MADYNSRFTGAQVDMAVEMALNGGGDVLSGTSAPTTSTVGKVGDMYYRYLTGQEFVCVEATGGVYTWIEVNGELSASVDDIYYTTDDLNAKIGATTDTGGTASAGTVNAKLNALLSSGGGSITGSDGGKYIPTFGREEYIYFVPLIRGFSNVKGFRVYQGYAYIYSENMLRQYRLSDLTLTFEQFTSSFGFKGVDFLGPFVYVFMANGVKKYNYSDMSLVSNISFPDVSILSVYYGNNNCVVYSDAKIRNFDKTTDTFSSYSIACPSSTGYKGFCTNGEYIWFINTSSSTEAVVKRALVSTGEINATSVVMIKGGSLTFFNGALYSSSYSSNNLFDLCEWTLDLSTMKTVTGSIRYREWIEPQNFLLIPDTKYPINHVAFIGNCSVASSNTAGGYIGETISSILSIIHTSYEIITDTQYGKKYNIITCQQMEDGTIYALFKSQDNNSLIYFGIIHINKVIYDIVGYEKQ